ncbi:threonine ammonia-lyase [Litorimonas haliclonae]|uniref:threonine ammonia-lyase n=1 Tax=Litorimonas haliclonae TaxID=2081977 RepID=UPI0039EEC5BE
MNSRVPSFEDVLSASKRLEGHARVTSLLRSDQVDEICGCQLFLKAEAKQKGGAFKYRGARNRLSQLSPQESKIGVVAFSSGNHAIGIAISANELGVPAIIVMPKDAPKIKVETVLSYGAEIRFYDRLTESREHIAEHISRSSGRVVVPSFDDPYIIAGQGTIGIELAEQCPDLHSVVVNLGGGGMCAGISLALQKSCPEAKIFGAEPQNYNDHQLSLEAGERVSLSSPPATLCDALMTPQPGELTWAVNSQSLSDVFTVTDEDCLHAMALAKRELDVILEPGGAASLASIMKYKPFSPDQKVVVIGSGGNVDAEVMEQALSL